MPTFASSSDPLPAGWRRLDQPTYSHSKCPPIDPIVVNFTAAGFPRNVGVPLNMSAHVENGDDRPLRQFEKHSKITISFLVCSCISLTSLY